MKALVLVLSLVAAQTAMAVDFSTMSWSEILTSGQYDPDYSNKVLFQKASTWVPSFSKSLCTDGNFIYGGTTEVCVKYNGREDGTCVETRKVDLVQPIIGEREVCVKNAGKEDSSCEATETVVFVQSPKRMINVLAAGGGDNTSKTVLGQKAYTIPSCGELEPVPAN